MRARALPLKRGTLRAMCYQYVAPFNPTDSTTRALGMPGVSFFGIIVILLILFYSYYSHYSYNKK